MDKHACCKYVKQFFFYTFTFAVEPEQKLLYVQKQNTVLRKFVQAQQAELDNFERSLDAAINVSMELSALCHGVQSRAWCLYHKSVYS